MCDNRALNPVSHLILMPLERLPFSRQIAFATGKLGFSILVNVINLQLVYFMGLTIVMTGLLYYLTVLLGLPPGLMGILLPVMVLVSFVFYPAVNLIAKRTGKKPLITRDVGGYLP